MLILTPVRRRILQAIDREPGRFYLEAGQVWDARTGRKHTAEFRKFTAAGWLRVASEDERPDTWLPGRKYYKVAATGYARLGAHKGEA